MPKAVRLGLVIVASTLVLTACAASPVPLDEYVVGTWTCTQTGTTEAWNGGNENGTSYVITLDAEGTGSSQMQNAEGNAINEEFPLTYAISGSNLKVSLDHFGQPLTIAGVPADVENDSQAGLSLGGIDWLNSAFTTTVKDRTVSGIDWDGALFTCAAEK